MPGCWTPQPGKGKSIHPIKTTTNYETRFPYFRLSKVGTSFYVIRPFEFQILIIFTKNPLWEEVMSNVHSLTSEYVEIDIL